MVKPRKLSLEGRTFASHSRALGGGVLRVCWGGGLRGGPAPSDRVMVAEVAALGVAPALIDTGGRLSFNQLVTLLQRASLYVGPDTSVTHLAAACGVPVRL